MGLIGYARISTTDQNPEAQTDALTAAGCERTFVDHGVSGKLAKRPKLDAVMDYVRAGDVLVITKLDRLGRSVKNLIELATPDKLATARTLVDGKQHTMQQIADVIGVSRASLYRALDEKAGA